MINKLIIRSYGGFAFEFERDWSCGKAENGLGIRVSQLLNNRNSKLKFNGGMVISRNDAKKLRDFIRKG